MKKEIPQEWLRAVALVTMLIDHVGYLLFPRLIYLRGIGRLAFPIFAFLLAEGAEHTRHPVKYTLRLLFSAFLSEYPFDYMLAGRWYMGYQNVIFTLFFALLAIYALKYSQNRGWTVRLAGVMAALYCTVSAEVLHTDYGAFGVLTCLVFWLFRGRKLAPVLETAAFLALCFWLEKVKIPHTRIPIETLGALSIPLMCLYKGRRASHSKALQWAFYLFYPVHMAVVGLIGRW